jgi:DnaK suppressor protein
MSIMKKTKKDTHKSSTKTAPAPVARAADKAKAKTRKSPRAVKAEAPALPPEDKIESVPVEKNIKPFTKKELEHFRQLLLEKRHELVGDVDHMGGGVLNGNRQDSTGELSNMPIHMADVGTDNYEQEFTLGLIESERKLLRDIDDALGKIDNGTYGICEGTGNSIDRSRLEAKPEARYSIEYARLIEKGLVRRREERTEAMIGGDDWEDAVEDSPRDVD